MGRNPGGSAEGPKHGWGVRDPLKELGRGLQAGTKGWRPPQGAGARSPSRAKGKRDPLREPGRGNRAPSESWGGREGPGPPPKKPGWGSPRRAMAPGALRAAGRGSRVLGAAGRRFQPDALGTRTAPWRPPRAEGTARARHVRQGVPREGQHQHQGLGPVSAAPGPRRDPRRARGTRGARPRGRGRGRRCPRVSLLSLLCL